MVLSNNTNTNSFFHFIIRNPRNKKYLMIALGGTIVQFIIFKILYPFPDFFSDSYSYIYAAQANLDVSIWPIGYSKFLRWFHFITYSDTALISFQYFFYELSALYFFFSLLYFYKPVKTNEIILFIFLFFNPLFLYLCNYVNSDPLFLALSLFWFTELLWIINRPRVYQLFVQAVLLFACFTVRNNAYYYPLISVVAFLISKQSIQRKAAGILAPLLFFVPFIIHTRNEAFKMTGTRQYSMFTGWQLANNVLYMYEYAAIDTTRFPSKQTSDLNHYSIYFYSHVSKDFRLKYLTPYVGNFFIREPYSPLKTYYLTHYRFTNDSTQVVAWGKASAVFGEYASYIIKRNVGAYLWEFTGVNMRHYIMPQLEKFDTYNMGEDQVEQIALHWFHYTSPHVKVVSRTIQGKLLKLFPPLFFFLNAYMLGCLLVLMVNGRLPSSDRTARATVTLGLAFVLANFLFCVSTTIIVFRYQVFPMVVLLLLALLLTERMQPNYITPKNKLHHA